MGAPSKDTSMPMQSVQERGKRHHPAAQTIKTAELLI
jgi:hypothetical protein